MISILLIVESDRHCKTEHGIMQIEFGGQTAKPLVEVLCTSTKYGPVPLLW